MSDFSQSVREYIRASEVLLKVDDLSEQEHELVEEMVERITEKIRDLRNNGPT